MQHDPLLIVVSILVAIAIIAFIVVGAVMAVAIVELRKRLDKVLAVVDEHALPLIATTRALVDELAPRIRVITNNVAETSETVKTHVGTISVAVQDTVDKVQQQVAHATRVTSNTLDAVDTTRNQVQRIVDAPLRVATGVVNGVTVALDRFFASRSRRPASAIETTRIADTDALD